ncbi:hypothetical protein GW587_26900 [Duganella sp. SAP-35]|uniref:Uncharacterized protein n=1 Tax=Duganella aceris TaxID=2703883 RepID=A0ABX0FT59_9BURK|nr:hypothetical protein [Duganella aceris]
MPSDVYVDLVNRTGEPCYGDKSEAVLSALIRNWLAGAASAPESRADDKTTSTKGYQWKQVFLPDGTELRATFQGRSTYAKVENEKIICGGECITPSRLANANGCGTRNAWRAIWLKFPGTSKWQLAASCRTIA